MADKRIDQLTAASSLGDSDLLVVEQSNEAKKATGGIVASYINGKYNMTGMASNISALQTSIAGKQDKLTLPLSVVQGGTGASTVGNARVNLGLGTAATANIDIELETAGDAADAQVVGKWTEQLETLIHETGEGYTATPVEFIDGGYIDQTNGNVVEYATWKYTDYIDCVAGMKIATTNRSAYNAYYDSSKNFISYFEFNAGITELSIPSNAAYMRLSGLNTFVAASILTESGVMQEISNVAKSFSGDLLKNGQWEQGTRGNAGEIIDSTIRVTWSEAIAVDPSKKYHVTVPDGYEVSLWFYRVNNGALVYVDWATYFGVDSDVPIALNTDRVLIVVLKGRYAQDGTPIVASDPNLSQITMTELPYTQTKECIRVCSYNVGLWNDGANPGVPSADVATKTNTWRRFIGANDPDFMLLQEAREYFDASNTKKASSQIFSNNYPKWFWLNTAKMLGIASKYNANDIEMVSTGTFSDRPYVKFWADINGKKVNFILCHLSIEASSSGARQDQMSELATLLGTYEYGVLCGDFNAYSTGEFDTHFSAFNMANHGWFGDYATWPHGDSSWPNECIDNIITTKNITIRNVELGTEVLSDHMPLFAELDIY